MRDFTLRSYEQYLNILIEKNYQFIRIDEYLALKTQPTRFCIIRHDVDRFPKRALNMALLEKKIGVVSTYYFRAKRYTFKPDIITEIAEMGHEIGYHYESLSDANGDMRLALNDFKRNLGMFRNIVDVKTIAMHGRPLKSFDNRDMWRSNENYEKLKLLNITGEVYLDIDYSNIAYLNDTGRNWTSGLNNRRDKVKSNIDSSFNSKQELLSYLKKEPHSSIIFQIHPERWTKSILGFCFQITLDNGINFAKKILK